MAIPCTPSGYRHLTHEELVRECENKQRVIECLNKDRDDVDGERYRWLRNKSADQYEHPIVVTQGRSPSGMKYVGPLFNESLDKAIDAARNVASNSGGSKG